MEIASTDFHGVCITQATFPSWMSRVRVSSPALSSLILADGDGRDDGNTIKNPARAKHPRGAVLDCLARFAEIKAALRSPHTAPSDPVLRCTRLAALPGAARRSFHPLSMSGKTN